MTLSLHTIKPNKGSHHRRKRLGRGLGSGHGAYSTRGIKGQRARQGGRKGLVQFGVKHFVTRLPKVRGFKSEYDKMQIVYVADLAVFSAGVKVNAKLLKKHDLIDKANLAVKLIGQGKAPANLTVMVQAASKGAVKAVESAGGKVELVS